MSDYAYAFTGASVSKSAQEALGLSPAMQGGAIISHTG